MRNRYGLSQSKFAELMGISVSTIRNLEQVRRAGDFSPPA
ncbi:MAG: helix-turn-helix domain-containing protein [Bacteroidota bacterium]